MGRWYTHRNGVEWGFFQVISEDPVEFFARSIQREDAPGLAVEEIASEIKVSHVAGSDQIGHMEYHLGGYSHFWHAEPESDADRIPRETRERAIESAHKKAEDS